MKIDVLKLKEFKSSRSAQNIDNFLFGIEQYFTTIGIRDDIINVRTAVMYLTNFAML